MRHFYHGTNEAGIKILNAVSGSHTVSARVVYLTPIRAYALFYLRDREINWVTCGVTEDGIVKYNEQFPNQLEKLYKGRSGYIYDCADDGSFQETPTRGVWQTDKSITVDKPEFVADAYSEILNCEKDGEITVVRYETLNNEEKQTIYEMMVHYIFKNNLTEQSSARAAFFKDSFPKAWDYVINNPTRRQAVLDEWQAKINSK